MVSKTFLNLTPAKQARIQAALLHEFSHHPLAEAQVSRIVAQAQIARGAFYKYFTDLTDAYRYLYHQAMAAIHADFAKTATTEFTPDIYLKEVRLFVDQANNGPYYQLIKYHLTQNEALLTPPATTLNDKLPSNIWAAAILSHETIKQILCAPHTEKAALKRLASALDALKETRD